MHKRPTVRLSTVLLVAVLLWIGASAVHAGDAAALVTAIEAAHGRASWQAQPALQADLVVDFGGQRMVDGKLVTDTPVGRVRLDLADGTRLVFDGSEAWVSPADSAFQGARFHLLTWPYFLAAPMKLRDPGTHLEALGEQPLEPGKALPAARLTFDPGTGDSPDDWYVLYVDPTTDRLAGMAYIVTYSQSAAEAEKEPHAITYHDYVEVDGVAVPTHWKFWLWNADQGLHGEAIGEARLSNVHFVTPSADAFVKPADARRDARPGEATPAAE